MGLDLFKYKKAQKRIKEAGVTKFYYDRKVLSLDVGSIGDFVGTASKNVTYVGCWLSSSLKQDLTQKIIQKVMEGVVFVFCLHAPGTQAIQEYASFFGLDEISVNTQIEDSILTLYNTKNSLPPELSHNIQIYWHSEMITTSFWLIDNAKIQLDFKLVKTVSRWFSFGVEIIPSSADFFENVKSSYLAVIDERHMVDDNYIDDIDGTRKKKEELKKEIIKLYPFDSSKPYLFISYSHRDDITMLNDLLYIKQHINCWVDFEMLDGGRNRAENDWTQKIRPVLESNNCLGVISYVSRKSFASKGFIQECDWIKIHRPNFYCFLVDFPKSITTSNMLTEIRGFCIEQESERDKQIRDEALTYITQATSSGKESYYHVDKNQRHLNSTDFLNWLKAIQSRV